MGDRVYRYFSCPKCGSEVEEYDAPSCVQHSSHCDACQWDDGLSYYESINENGSIEVMLLTLDQAKEKGLILECPMCQKYEMAKWEQEKFGKCFMCYQDLQKIL